ncbi:hypothetical protein AB0J35_32085 [Nonomuraea angiospora]|uniref:hypothetical protein n=1 Tax=Nonomuraea angiospora TaxID=46172 RepID=UPI00343CACBC
MSEKDSGFATKVVALVATIPLRVRYLVVGLPLGLAWGVQGGPLWQRAAIMSVVLLVAPPLLHLARVRMTRAQPRPDRPHASLLRFTVAKAILVALAIFATWLLQSVTAYAEIIIGVAMAATVATLGPVLHPSLLISPRKPELKNAVLTTATKDG